MLTKMDYRFIVLVNKKTNVVAFSIVPPLLSCQSAFPQGLSLSTCRWVCFLVLSQLAENMGHSSYTNSCFVVFRFGHASSPAPLLYFVDILLLVHYPFIRIGSYRLRPPFYLCKYLSTVFRLGTGWFHTFLFPNHSLESHPACFDSLLKYLVMCSGTIIFLA
jgi:hypothetical protein